MTDYRYTAGGVKPKGVSAQITGEHLEYLRENAGGELTAQIVVEHARNENSPLHTAFTWDDTEAARQHRLNEARRLIKSVQIVYRSTDDKTPESISAFVHISEGRPHYTSTIAALSDQEKRQIVLRKAWNDMQSFKKKYSELHELAGVLGEIERFEETLPPVLQAAQ